MCDVYLDMHGGGRQGQHEHVLRHGYIGLDMCARSGAHRIYAHALWRQPLLTSV